MAAEDCIAEVERIVGRKLSDEEADRVFSDLHRAMTRRREDNAAEAIEDAYLNAARELGESRIAESVIQRRNAIINETARLVNEDLIVSQFIKNPALGFEATLTGVNAALPGARRSAAAEQRQLAGSYMMGMIADMERGGVWNIFVRGELDQEVYRALYKLGDDVDGARAPTSDIRGEPVSREAEQIAEIIHKWQEVARLDANRAGAWIRGLPGYITRQSHDMYKIRRADRAEYKAFTLERLHPRTFDDIPGGADAKSVDAFLEEVYNGLASGVHLTHSAGGAPSHLPSGVSASLAKRMSQDRVLHFKDADAAFEYNQRFGAGSLRESVLFGLEGMARNTGLMRIWGTNPEANFAETVKAVQKRLDPAGREALESAKNTWLSNRMMEVDGSINIPGNAMMAKWGAITRAIQSMSKLGGAVLSAVSDLPILASELRYQGVGFLERWNIAFGSLRRGYGTTAQREISSMLGVTLDGMVGQMIHRYSGQDDLPGVFSRWMRTFFKWNGLTWWTDSLRMGTALGMSSRLAFNRNRAWGELDPDLARTLGLFGIDGGKWDMLRRTGVRETDGQSFLVPEGAREIADLDIKRYLEARGETATSRRIANFRSELEGDLRSYFVDRVDYAVINPDARTNAVLRRGLQPGTIEGEALRFVTQFKSFPVAVLQKPLGRELYGRGVDIDASGLRGLFTALRNGDGEMEGLVRLLVTTAAFGYLAMSAKDVAKGRVPRDPLDSKTWLAALAQGGGAGIYGDFLFGEAKNRFGQSALGTFLGPTFGSASDLVDMFTTFRDGDVGGGGAKSFNYLINHMPFANLFYTRAALDYLFLYGLRDAMSPGYARRMESRIKRENGQDFLIRPTEALFVR